MATTAPFATDFSRSSIVPRRLLRAGLLTGVFALGLLIYSGWEYVSRTIPELYAQEWVADLLITHMRLNDGQWPASWDDLEEAFQINAARAGQPWTFDDLRERVAIDFSADPNELARSVLQDGKVPFRVVWLRSGDHHHWAGGEPNLMVWRYLQKNENATKENSPLVHPVAEEKRSRAALLALGARWTIDQTGHVKEAQLTSRNLSDPDMDFVKGLSQLRGLNLGDSGIGDAGMERVRNLTRLEWIYLYRSNVTDAGLGCLEGMEDLKTLVLADAKFTDNAFDTIVRLKNLQLLNLNGARVTDLGISRLHSMDNLKEVMLYDTLVTREGVRQLRSALPGCVVSFPDD